MNPQRLAFKEHYCNPHSETFGNAKQSAMKAGFSKSYAGQIMSDDRGNDWVREIVRDSEMLSKAEKVLGECLEMETEQKIKKGKTTIRVNDPHLLRIKQDTAKFVAKTIGKEKYSERTELTGKDGAPIATVQVTDDEFKKALATYGDNAGTEGGNP